MHRVSKNGLDSFQFDDPVFNNCIHGIFTRKGGVSRGQWTSLNQGSNMGDDRDNVYENRARTFNFYDRKVESIFDVWQVHSTDVVCAEQPRDLNEPHQKADAIFTNNPHITLFMRFADCVPIMVYDPVKTVVGLIHAGWKGTVNNIVGESINAIAKRYDVDPGTVHVGIGPSIGPDHYAVGEEVVLQVRKNFGDASRSLLTTVGSYTHFDLWQANHFWLEQAGVRSIETARICTACHLEDWFSHRAEKGLTGRFGAMIALKDQ